MEPVVKAAIITASGAVFVGILAFIGVMISKGKGKSAQMTSQTQTRNPGAVQQSGVTVNGSQTIVLGEASKEKKRLALIWIPIVALIVVG